MPVKRTYLILSILAVALLCVAQVLGNTLLIMACMVLFLALVGWCCSENFTLPILLFFLPWSQLLKLTPTGYSFFTFALVLTCGISIIKKRFHFRRYPIVICIALLAMTIFSKILNGVAISFDYVAFMMLILCFPVVKGEWIVKKYDFYHVVIFFSVGVILAALCAQSLALFPNIAQYIRVDTYATITRRTGFYGDANFYSAQITAALAGCLILLLQQRGKVRIAVLAVLLISLVYCGFLSGSKSFVIVSAAAICLWMIAVIRMPGRTGLKVGAMIGVIAVLVLVGTSALFSDLIDVVLTRFSYSTDLDSFTTGRTELWMMYLKEIVSDLKIFFLGQGFTNVKVEGRGSHNTLLQAVFQFGVLGVPMLICWTVSFFRGASRGRRHKRVPKLEMALMLVGTFVPWLAIDALFFDEYFLLQWYVFCAMLQMTQPYALQADPVEETYGRTDQI